MDLLQIEIILHWTAVVLYAFATVAYSVNTIFEKEKLYRVGVGFSVVGLLPHTAAILIRWIVSEHGPYVARYEVMSSNAWVFVVMYLAFSARIKKIRFTGMVVMPFSFLAMAYGLFTNPAIKELPPSLNSVWLILHIGFYKLAVGAIIISLTTAIFYLLKEGESKWSFLAKLPSLPAIDYYSHRFASFGFTFWSIGIIAGSIWANDSWGRYWGWDPIETWSLLTWVFYGFYLHVRLFFGWRGRKAAFLVIGCFSLSFITAFIIPVAKTFSVHTSYFV